MATVQDRFIGDPLDIEMFKTTGWVIDESEQINHATDQVDLVTYYLPGVKDNIEKSPQGLNYKLGVIKRFDFSSNLQCMSVISRNPFDENIVGFVKGSPERIQSIAIPSTIPKNFSEILMNYTQDGLRVLALSYKYLTWATYEQAKAMDREDIE